MVVAGAGGVVVSDVLEEVALSVVWENSHSVVLVVVSALVVVSRRTGVVVVVVAAEVVGADSGVVE